MELLLFDKLQLPITPYPCNFFIADKFVSNEKYYCIIWKFIPMSFNIILYFPYFLCISEMKKVYKIITKEVLKSISFFLVFL